MSTSAMRPRTRPGDQPGSYLFGGPAPANAGPEIEPEIERLILCGDPCAWSLAKTLRDPQRREYLSKLAFDVDQLSRKLFEASDRTQGIAPFIAAAYAEFVGAAPAPAASVDLARPAADELAQVDRAIDSDTAWQLDYMFDNQDGWLCLGFVDGDPSIPKGTPGYTPLSEEWYRWPRQRTDALQRLAQLDQRGINTYVRQCLFTRCSGAQAYALPSCIVWQDDVTDPQKPCSVLIQTSERKYQAMLRLDRPAAMAERKRLASQWHARSADTEDAQHASYDPVHHIRVAGGHNSKGHGWYPVHYARRSERIYSADQLLERCTGETHTSSSPVSKARAEQHQADAWRNLPDGRRLLNSKRWQAIITGRPQLRQLLIDRQPVIITNKNGQPDDSNSAQRAVFVQNLITAWSAKRPGHLPEREIRAVALSLRTMLGDGKTKQQYQVDIDWLIAEYRPKNYRPVATRYVAGAGQPIHAEPLSDSRTMRRRGRPYRPEQTRAAHLDLLRQILASAPADAFGRIPIRTCALADQLGKTDRMVRNYLRDLQMNGEIKSGRIGRTVYVVLTATFGASMPQSTPADAEELRKLNPITIDLDDAPVLPVETPQTALRGEAAIGETEDPDPARKEESVYPPDRATGFPQLALDPSRETELPPAKETSEAEPPARLTLELLMREAGDAYPGCASFRKWRAYVLSNSSGQNWSDEAIVDWYGREKKRRQRARQDAREAEKARQLRWSALVRKSQNLASQAAAMLRRGDPRGPIWERRAGIYAAEEARREVAGEAPSERLKPKRKPRGYTSAESDAWLATKGAQVRAPWDDQGVTAAGVSPPTHADRSTPRPSAPRIRESGGRFQLWNANGTAAWYSTRAAALAAAGALQQGG